MARQFYTVNVKSKTGEVLTFEKPVRAFAIRSLGTCIITPGTAAGGNSLTLPNNVIITIDLQRKNTGKGLKHLYLDNQLSADTTVYISVIEYGDEASGDDSYFM